MKVISIPNNNWKLPSEVKDGEICIVREWFNTNNPPIGALMQRYLNNFIILGKGWGSAYEGLSDNVRLEVLPKGTIIEL